MESKAQKLVGNLAPPPSGTIVIWFPDSVTTLRSPSCWSWKTSRESGRQYFGAGPGLGFVATFSSCTHVLSGTDGDANVPLGSVNSIAFFSSVPVGKKCDSTQTVAVRLIGGGFGFPGTLKSTLALQNVGSIVACTVQLSGDRHTMESHIVSAQMPQTNAT